MTPERASSRPTEALSEHRANCHPFSHRATGPVRRDTSRKKAASAQPERLDEVLTPPEVSVLLKVPERTLSDWRYMQKGPPFHKVGKHIRYVAEEVRAWLACQ